MICSATEILYKNCHERSNVENFTNYLKNNNFDSEKENFSENDDNLTIKKKRISYRAKANDYEKKKNKKAESTKNKNKTQVEGVGQIKVLSKNSDKKIEKRQGWWSQ